MQIEFKQLDPRAQIEHLKPSTIGSAGVDLRVLTPVDLSITLEPGVNATFSTGIAIHIKDPGFAAIIIPRSGLGCKKGLVLGNLVGLIDSDYQGELKVNLWNRGSYDQEITHQMRVAQLVIVPVMSPTFVQVEEFSTETVRGEGGFGSTGQ